MESSLVQDTISQQGLVSLNIASIEIRDSKFLGNFAVMNTNGIQAINSNVIIDGCTIDNAENKHGFLDERIRSIPCGFLNMNYES